MTTTLPRRYSALALCCLAAGAAACATVPRPSMPATSAVAPLDKKEKAGAILVEETEVIFERDDKSGEPVARVMYHRLGQIAGNRGQWLRAVDAGYDATFTKVDDIFAQVRTPDGEEKSWDRKDAVDVPSMPGFILYSDDRSLVLMPPMQPPGSVADVFTATVTTSPHLFIFGHSFGGALPVKLSRFTVRAPEGWDVEVTGEAMDVQKDVAPSSTTKDGGVVTRIWEEKDRPAQKSIRNGLASDAQHDHVTVRLKAWTTVDGQARHGPADDKALSAEEFALGHGAATATPALHATVAEALQSVPPGDDHEAERAAKLYAWVRDHVRYCAIEIGMGGFVPHPAGEVHKARYGDCKDKATLLHTLLADAGIKSRTVLIAAGDWPRRFRLPALGGNFNHMIVVVDLKSGPVFADPTSRTAAFGELPESDEDRVLLPVSEAGAALLDAPASSPQRDVIEESGDLTLRPDGSADGAFTSSMSGAPAESLRTRLLMNPPKRRAEIVQQEMALWNPKVSKLVVENEAPPEVPTPVVAKGNVKLHVFRGGVAGDTALRASFFSGEAFAPLDDDHRGPFFLGAAHARHTVLKLHMPSGTKFGALPAAVDVDAAAGAFQEKWSIDGDVVTLERTVVVKQRVVPANAIADLKALLAAANAGDAQPLVVSIAGGGA